MDIRVFPDSELSVALGAIRGVVAAPNPAQDRFLEVVALLHRTAIDPKKLPAPSPEETARAVRDSHRRKRLLQLAVILPMIDGEVEGTEVAAVAELASALDIDEQATSTLHELARHNHLATRIDIVRRTLGKFVSEAWRDEKWTGVRKMIGPMLDVGGGDPALAWRYRELGLLPRDTFGRVFWEHMTKRHFAFPGEPGGIPERAVFHDFGHVLSGYDTDPDGEIQQAAFQSGFVRKDGFAFLFFGVVQFHLGIKITPVAEPEVGYFDVDKVMLALSRGADCRVDLSDRWDHWAYMARPLAEVREELGIPALAA